MSISKTVFKNHEELFPNRKSKLMETDPLFWRLPDQNRNRYPNAGTANVFHAPVIGWL